MLETLSVKPKFRKYALVKLSPDCGEAVR
jgi:hypothetical protein